jgi:hypothetical protein
MKLIKFNNLNTEENKTKIIGLLTILIIIWVIFYFIPSIFALLFSTFLGNLILFIITILVTLNNVPYGIILGLLFVIIIRFASLSSAFNNITNKITNNSTQVKEGFELSNNSITKFIRLQQTMNPKVIFDINILKQEVNQKELDYFLKNKKWPWSKEVTKLYNYHLKKNPYIQMYPQVSLDKVQTIYYQSAILKILSAQSKEGQFLLNGVNITNTNFQNREGAGSYPYNSGQITPLISGEGELIKCGINNQSQQFELQKIKYNENNGILGYHTKDIQNISYNSLPDMIPGFKFVKGNCDPCVAFNNPPNYECPFHLEVKDRPQGISPIWQYLWGLNPDPLKSEPSLVESQIQNKSQNKSQNKNNKDFPLFKEIKPELNKIYVTTGISEKK